MTELAGWLHLVGRVLVQPFTDPGNRTYWVGLVVFAVVGAIFWATQRPQGWSLRRGWRLLWHPSTGLDVQIFVGRQLLRLFSGAPTLAAAWWLASHAVRLLDAWVGIPPQLGWSTATVSVLYSVVLFVSWDFSRWVLHWLAHRVEVLWAFHQIHHSAELMTPLTFHRIHPVESVLAAVRSTLVTAAVAAAFFWLFRGAATSITILGVPAAGWLLNVATGNLRHSHVRIPFPQPVERWLLSPAQHQIHHSVERSECDSNYGTWLAVWDRMAGTLLTSEVEPAAFGIPAEVRNHGNDLLSAWFGPFRSVGRQLRR
jgi:sterol desaturase/sphingolipid hydroxylase (fatty acid hydroxylase superfamily)